MVLVWKSEVVFVSKLYLLLMFFLVPIDFLLKKNVVSFFFKMIFKPNIRKGINFLDDGASYAILGYVFSYFLSVRRQIRGLKDLSII